LTHRDDKEFPRGRRKHRRVEAREVTATVRAGGKTVSYTVVNISAGGMLVSGAPAPPRGPTLEIELRRPGMAPIGLNGLFAHEDAAHRVGLVFAAPSERAAAAVEKLIAAVEATGGAPPPLPGLRANTGESSVPAVAPPADDPFNQGADPRPPRAGSLDERNEYLRVLVKRRDEALQHGRGLFAAATSEAAELRETVAKLEAKLMASLSQARAAETALTAERRTSDEQGRTLKAERKASSEALDEETKRTLEAMGSNTALKAKVKKLEAELSASRSESAATLKATTAQLKAELAEQRAVAESAMKATTQQLGAELADQRAVAAAELKDTTERLEAELAKTRIEAAAKLKAKTRQFEVEFAEARSQAEAALKAKTKQFDAELSEARSQAEAALKAKSKQYEVELSAARREAEKAARELQQLRNEVASYAKAIAAQAELDKARTARDGAVETLAEVRDARNNAEAELEKMGSELGKLKEKLEAADAALGPFGSRRKTETGSRRPGVR
jgi:chromosome segregation ATPase